MVTVFTVNHLVAASGLLNHSTRGFLVGPGRRGTEWVGLGAPLPPTRRLGRSPPPTRPSSAVGRCKN